MKNFLIALMIIVSGAIVIVSCTKMQMSNQSLTSKNLDQTANVKPNIPACVPGYHYDTYLKKCVPTCSVGYHNDSITGACVVDGGSGGYTNITVISNLSNPNEIVGQTHNIGLSVIMPNYNNGILEPTEQNVFSYTKSYLATQQYDTTLLNDANNYVLQNLGPVYQQTNLTSLTNLMYSNGAISITAKNYLLQLANFISSFAADSTSIPTQTSYNIFANNLITYENQISGNSSLTANDKYILFSAFSVARYSAVYAINYSIQLSSPPQSGPNMQPNKVTSWFSWGTVLGGDVVGAASGALGGAAVGALAGGVGAGPGAVAGALGGGISGSAYEAGMQLWHHFF